MRVGTPGFLPERLMEARQARRIGSKSELSRLLGVAPSTITRWEDGSSAPDSDALTKLSSFFRVRREFFLRPSYSPSRPLFYRKFASALVGDLAYQHSQMNWLHEISDLVQHYIDLPALDIPDVLAGAHYKQLRDEDLERIALDLRHHWQLGFGPCPDMVSHLERVGIVVSTIEMGTSKLDGLCSWSVSEDRPHILLATDKMCYPRRQMDAAHEMAHAVLHRGVTDDELRGNLEFIEAQAFRLASAFLMPSVTYPLEVSRPSLATLLTLKERWRVSIKAQIVRLKGLDLIPPEHAQQMFKLYSAKGWNSEEPLDKLWPVTQPRLLRDALQLIVDSGTRNRADLLSVEFTMSGDDVERLASLPTNWFSARGGDVVQLKPQLRDRANGTDGVVVPFRRNT